MMSLIIGISNLLLGVAYVGLGLLSAWEAASQYRYRGLSRFGLGFSLMAASCGPHHLVHGWCVLQGGTVSTPMLALTLTGLPAGIVFCWLRAEAMLDGRGDRTLAINGRVMAAVTITLLIVMSSLAGWAMASPPPPPYSIVCTAQGIQSGLYALNTNLAPSSLVLYSNLWVTFAYAMVGWYLLDTQISRYVSTRSWSLSGLSLAGVFPTCAAMHLILALTSSQQTSTLPFDLLGIPASIYFLWVVKQLHADSVIDWNRRPLAGLATLPHRSSPWNETIKQER
ncbi:hypothetical protein [Chitinibacter sp. S2-10]|uniref:hypothetical protein n=1 Tax=Chitinibacter sp. S2-10 TaxID=3373597 RepID=UPI00397735A5